MRAEATRIDGRSMGDFRRTPGHPGPPSPHSFTAHPGSAAGRTSFATRWANRAKKHKDAIARALSTVRKHDDAKVCLAEAERIAAQWESLYPRLSRQVREQFEETLAVHALPNPHRRRVYTTNMMERVMREIKRRSNVVGIFPNESSANRLIGAHLLEPHESCCERARYTCMEHLDKPAQLSQDKAKAA